MKRRIREIRRGRRQWIVVLACGHVFRYCRRPTERLIHCDAGASLYDCQGPARKPHVVVR